MIIKVEEFFAVERLEASQNTLTNTPNSNSTDNLALKIELVLGSTSNVPLASLDLLVCGDKIADQDEDGHDDMFCDGDDVRASNFCDCDTAVGLVRCVQVDVVGSDTCCDGDLELLGLGETLCGEVTRVESAKYMLDESIERY